MAAYRDPAWRARAWEELAGRQRRAADRTSTSLSVAESSAHPELIGRRVVDLAAERGRDDAARRHARPLARGAPRDALLERARQQRSRSDRVAAPAGHGAARAGRLRRAREPAVRRVLRDRPARQLGARQGSHAARARDPQAHRRAGRRCSGCDDRGTLEVGKAADVVVFDSDRRAPDRCAASATSPPTANGSSPTSRKACATSS